MRAETKKIKFSPPMGFSLVELMVSLSIFAIVMTVSVGTLLVMIDANAKAQALYQSMTNLSFAVDSMSRNLRTANTYYCGSASETGIAYTWPIHSEQNPDLRTKDCLGGDNAIIFTRERDSARVGYRLNQNTIEQKVYPLDRTQGNWIPITSEDVKITALNITVTGTDDYYDDDDISQPKILLLIEGYVENGLDTETDFVLQTNITQQVLNY